MNTKVKVLFGCAAALAWSGTASSRAQESAARPPAPAAPLRVKAGEWITNGPVRLRVVRVMDPYFDPSDYESEPRKDAAGRTLQSRYCALMLEYQNLTKEQINVYFDNCQLIDDKGAGTPLTGGLGEISPAPGRQRFQNLKFNPLKAFGQPKELVFQLNTYPSLGAPPSLPREQQAQAQKLREEKQEQFRHAYPTSDRLFQVVLNTVPAKEAQTRTSHATKKTK